MKQYWMGGRYVIEHDIPTPSKMVEKVAGALYLAAAFREGCEPAEAWRRWRIERTLVLLQYRSDAVAAIKATMEALTLTAERNDGLVMEFDAAEWVERMEKP